MREERVFVAICRLCLLGLAAVSAEFAGSSPMGAAVRAPSHAGQAASRAGGPGRPCRRVVVEVSAKAGQSVHQRATGTLDVDLEPTGRGWVLRVVPHQAPMEGVDYAGIATPPYRSMSPLRLSTEFGLRAQDAVGWNPREFHFATDGRAFAAFLPVYRAIVGMGRPKAEDEAALGRLIATAAEGSIEILDARLVPGTADQSRAAAAVASHFDSTAHTLEQPNAGGGSAAGEIGAVRLRIVLDLQHGSTAAPGAREVAALCSGR